MRSLTLLSHVFLIVLCSSIGRAENDAHPPNVVLIVADDLGYHELGCYGQTKIRTPRLDRLRTEGMKFTRAYSGSPVCAPSRCVLLTGKHPGHTYVRSNREVKPEGQLALPAAEITLAERFRAAGYTTGAFGKWGLGSPGSEGDPTHQGFNRFYGYNCQRVAHSYYPPHLWSNRDKVKLRIMPPVPGHAGLPEGADPADPKQYNQFKGTDYAPDLINTEALKFIRKHRDRPFFLYYPTVIPHLALHVPDEELEPYLKLGWKDPPFTREKGRGYTPHFTPRAAYAAMITRMDGYVGKVLDLLDELGLTKNTIVIFTSDNGTSHVKDEVDAKFFDSLGNLRGYKGSLHEGGIRVPMLARWPGKIAKSSTSNRMVGFEDMLPTLLELTTGKGASGSLDGASFASTLLGKPQPKRHFLYREFAGYGGQQAVWMGNHKAIRRKLSNENTVVKTELYDLSTDPSEQQNLAAKHPEIVARLEAIMSAQHTPSTIFPLRAIDQAGE